MLVTLDDMKNFLNIPLSETSHDAFLTMQISAVSEAIEMYCRRKFTPQEYVQTFYPEDFSKFDRAEIVLYHYPVIEVTEINSFSYPSPYFNNIRIHKPTGIIRGFGDYFGNFWGVTSTFRYRAGYDVIPAPILAAVYSLVEQKFKSKTEGGGEMDFGANVKGVSIPGVMNIQYDLSKASTNDDVMLGAILGNQVKVLDAYKSHRAVIGEVKLAYVEEAF